MNILGLWDGHDSGAALVGEGEIRFVINEERLTRRKLEVAFPARSIQTVLRATNLEPRQIDAVAVSTADPAKTLNRWFPTMKEQYYLLRRRKKLPSRFNAFKKLGKYWLTEFAPNALSRALSLRALWRELMPLGLAGRPLTLVDHHLCHAAGAALTAGFDRCLVITLDGLGDGLSATISQFGGGKLKRLAAIGARHSFGIFFEHVTNLMNMRELEDEGKVMALANFAYPIPDKENPLIGFFAVDGLQVQARYSSLRMYRELGRVLHQFPNEQFAGMAQRALEVWVIRLLRNALQASGQRNVALAGGVASNIKVNRLIKNLDEVDDVFVFPHMGDGGLALGAALWRWHELTGEAQMPLPSVQLGPEFSENEIESALRDSGLTFTKPDDPVAQTAARIADGGIVLWFQGRTEMGPRALGGRSVLARPDSLAIKDTLNLKLKKRVWYQPFCPSMLLDDARETLADLKGTPNRFMTMGYMVKPEHRPRLAGVINVDGSCRPQIVTDAPARYAQVLQEVKRRIGIGAVLNTSFNLHGEPMVNSPTDAIASFIKMKADALAIGNFWVEGKWND